ncbi:MAG: cell division protein FtsQ/DivIB [Bacillota bacterium]
MKKKIIIFLVIVVIIILFATRTNYFIIKEINYNNPSYKTDISFNDIINKKFNLLFISNNSLKKEILQKSVIKDVIIKKQFPDKLNLTIDYKKPFLKIKENKTSIIINKTGEVLLINPNINLNYEIHGLNIAYYKKGKKLKIYNQELLDRLMNLMFLIKKSNVDINHKIIYNNDSIVLETKEGIKVEFGNCKDIEERFNNFINIYIDLLDKGIKKGIIDVSITELPLFKGKD